MYYIILKVCSVIALIVSASALSQLNKSVISRRRVINTALASPILLLSEIASSSEQTIAILDPNPRAITTVRINSPNERAGLELFDVNIGTPSHNVLAVKAVQLTGQAAKAGAQRGMILLDYTNKSDLVERYESGVYPIEIRLYNLALGGDGIGDLGRSIVTPEDALELSASISSKDTSSIGVNNKLSVSEGLQINTIKKANGKCGVRSRRGDTMQVRYEARVGDSEGIIYDASEWRGTGQPYSYILGNNDVLRGVGLGTYDMCPGEIRELTIPPELGYRNGSKLYKQIPSNSPLFWRIELVELNFIKEGENDREREEDFY